MPGFEASATYGDSNAARSVAPTWRARPLGSRFGGQSLTYLFAMPLMLVLAGLVTWAVPSNDTFILGAALGGVAGLYILADVVFRGAPLRLSLLLAMALLIAYNLGTLNSFLTLPRGGLTLAEYFARDPASLARASGASMGAAALLLALGQLYERPVFGEEFRINFDGRSVVLICLSTVLVVGAYLTGQIGYMGVQVDEGGRISPLTALIMWWFAPAFAYSVCATLNTVGSTRLLVGACSLIQLLALIPVGRRNFAYAVLLAMMATRLGKFRSQLSLPKKLLAGVLGVALIVTASVGFLYLRVASWSHKGFVPISTRIRMAMDLAHSRSPAEILQLMQANSATRTFYIGYFSDLLEASQRSTPMLGADLAYNLQMLVPSAISANKFGISMYGEEQMADMKWGFSYTDEANSLLTAGAADFSIIGVLLYPLVAVWLLRTMLEWMQFVMPTYGATIIALAFVYQMLLTEQLPLGYLIQIRNSLIFMGLLYVISVMPKFRWRGTEHR
jgi:hypothetical protein